MTCAGIKSGMGIIMHSSERLNGDIRRQDGIESVWKRFGQRLRDIKVKEITEGMDAGIRPGGACQRDWFPEQDVQSLLHLSLHGYGIVLNLESTETCSHIADFQEVSGHADHNVGTAIIRGAELMFSYGTGR